MNNINKTTVSDYTVSGEFEIGATVRPDEDAPKSSAKAVTLRFSFDNVPLAQVIQSALTQKRINWQVGARKKFASIVPKSVVNLKFTGGAEPVDPITEVINRAAAAGMTVDEYLKAELAKRPVPKLEPLT